MRRLIRSDYLYTSVHRTYCIMCEKISNILLEVHSYTWSNLHIDFYVVIL